MGNCTFLLATQGYILYYCLWNLLPWVKITICPPIEDLIFHFTTSVQYLKRKYVSPLFLTMGDFNDLPIDTICSVCDFKPEVDVPTREKKILDLIITNKNNMFYKKPINLPKIGEADHFPVLYKPKEYQNPKTSKK